MKFSKTSFPFRMTLLNNTVIISLSLLIFVNIQTNASYCAEDYILYNHNL